MILAATCPERLAGGDARSRDLGLRGGQAVYRVVLRRGQGHRDGQHPWQAVMTSGELRFNPQNYSCARTPRSGRRRSTRMGPTRVTTLVGQNSVMIFGAPRSLKEPQLGYGAQTIDVKDGTNTLNIELPPPSQAAGDAAKKNKPQ